MLYAVFWVISRRFNFVCRRFGTRCLFHLHRQVGHISYLPAYEKGTECPETSSYNIRSPWNYPEESIQQCIFCVTIVKESLVRAPLVKKFALLRELYNNIYFCDSYKLIILVSTEEMRCTKASFSSRQPHWCSTKSKNTTAVTSCSMRSCTCYLYRTKPYRSWATRYFQVWRSSQYSD